MIGAEIYTTVGNEEKVQYLVNTVGIPRHRIFHSRDSSFVTDVLRETDGRGVDIVLDSSSGDLLQASWRVVAKMGKMIEIGKRDFLEHGKLDMEMFQSNRSFHGVDLLELSRDDPGTIRQYG
jgi:NADPH:quinone reductase-like Zn-dependent oxidoreductase